MKAKIMISPGAEMPRKATKGSSCYDLHSVNDYMILYNQVVVIQTGVYLELPENTEAQIRSRSGLASRGVFVLNSPGTIDSDYREEIGVILMNLGQYPCNIRKGDRIAQMKLVKYEPIELEEVNSIMKTNRGGFGSTGK
jgi:dUTP pyrophosphatase